MPTTNGPMKTFKVTDKDGNVYVMTLVDTEARQSIDDAKNLEFDEDYFTSEVSQDEKTVNVGLNGVPLGVDSDSPLKFSQDNAQGIVISSDAPFSTAIAPEYDATATYDVGDHCMHLGKYYECNTVISTAEDWTAAHWTEIDVETSIQSISRFVSPSPGGVQGLAGSSSNGYNVDLPTNTSVGDMAWVITGLRVPSSGVVKSGDSYELRFNSYPMLISNHNVYLGLAKLVDIDTSNGIESFEVVSQKMAPRVLSTASNSFFGGGSSPIVFTFSKDVKFEADEYLYLMIGAKYYDASSPTTVFTAGPVVVQADYSNPLTRVRAAFNAWSRDVNSTFVDSTGILADSFKISFGSASDDMMMYQTFSNYFAFVNVNSTDITFSRGGGTGALAEICLVKTT